MLQYELALSTSAILSSSRQALDRSVLRLVFGSKGQRLCSYFLLVAITTLGACLDSRFSILGESDSTLGHEQVFSPLEYRSDAASAAECAGLRAERPCLAVYR